jgi:hypothetical protein
MSCANGFRLNDVLLRNLVVNSLSLRVDLGCILQNPYDQYYGGPFKLFYSTPKKNHVFTNACLCVTVTELFSRISNYLN